MLNINIFMLNLLLSSIQTERFLVKKWNMQSKYFPAKILNCCKLVQNCQHSANKCWTGVRKYCVVNYFISSVMYRKFCRKSKLGLSLWSINYKFLIVYPSLLYVLDSDLSTIWLSMLQCKYFNTSRTIKPNYIHEVSFWHRIRNGVFDGKIDLGHF